MFLKSNAKFLRINDVREKQTERPPEIIFNYLSSVMWNKKKLRKCKRKNLILENKSNAIIPILFWWFFAGHCTDLLWLSSVLAMAGASNLSLRWIDTSISTDIDRQYYNTALWFIKKCMKIGKFFDRILLNWRGLQKRGLGDYNVYIYIYLILERLYLSVQTRSIKSGCFRELARRSGLGKCAMFESFDLCVKVGRKETEGECAL